MIFAWLVLAHDAPAQLSRLIDRLLTDGDDFVVLHIDRNAQLWPVEAARIAAQFGERVILIDPPVRVRWGHHSQLVATRRAIAAASTRAFDVAHLISGRDWPVVARARIAQDIAAAPATCWIDTARTEQPERMQNWWLHAAFLNPRVKGGAIYRATKKLLRIASRLVDRIAPRAQPYGAWQKGAQWWSLPHDACISVANELRTLERSGRIRFTACSDEHVIQTIAAARFADRLGDPHRYADWSHGESSPKTLTSIDRPAITASGAWLARKVDAATDDWFYDPAI